MMKLRSWARDVFHLQPATAARPLPPTARQATITPGDTPGFFMRITFTSTSAAVAILLASSCVLGVVGCGGGKDEGKPVAAPAAAEREKVKPVQAPDVAKVEPKPATPPAPEKVEPKRSEQTPSIEPAKPVTNAVWERKSRAKLKEGLELLKAGKTTAATLAFQWPFADMPSELSTAQKEMMLELSARLSAVYFLVDKDEGKNPYTDHLNRLRRELGWDIDKFQAWAAKMFEDTQSRIGK